MILNYLVCCFLLNVIKFCQSDQDTTTNVITLSPNDPRIIGGTEAPAGRWPFMASLQNGGRHFCGGSILNDNTILTAAHCVLLGDPKKTKVYIGNVNNTQPDEKYLFQVKEFIPHEEFNSSNPMQGHDLALVKLEERIDLVEMKAKVSKVCLPSPESEPQMDKCIALGWGYTVGGSSGSVSSSLRQVDLPILPEASCAKGYNRKLIYCAGYADGKKGTCNGDSGSPIVCPSKSSDSSQKFAQYGITSFGMMGCSSYGYYTKSSAFLDFIRDKSEE